MYSIENEYGKMRILTHENSDFAKSAFCYTSKLGIYELGKMSVDNMQGIDEFIVIITLSGVGVAQIGNKTARAVPNSALIIPRNTDYSYRTSHECSEWNYYLIQIGGAAAQTMLSALIKYKGYSFDIRYATNAITDVVDEIMAEDFYEELEFEEKCHIELHKIMYLIYKSAFNRDKNGSDISQVTQLVSKYIKAHYRENISLDDLSKRCYISPAHLIRVFKDDTGFTPYSYLKQHRIKRAKELLRYTVLSIKDIALLVGFSDPSNFIKQFKSLEQITPDAYRTKSIEKS